MTKFLSAACLVTVFAMPAQASVVEFKLWDWPAAGNTNVASVTKAAATGERVTVSARLWSNIQPDQLTHLSQLTGTGTIRLTDGTSALNGGLGVTGGGSTEQVDTNTVTRREAFLVEGSTTLRLTALRLNMIDANDTLRVYGIESNGALTSLGFAGTIGGTGGNALQGATWNAGTGTLTFVPRLAPFRRLLLTTREGGEERTNNMLGQGYRLAAISAAVPEPATWAMMLGGFGLIGAVSRRRRTAVVHA